jgi:hypothetical protein
VRVELRDTGDLKAVAKALRAHADGKQLRKELTQGLRGVLRPEVAKVRAAYRAAPSRGGRRRRQGPGLRSRLAGATRLEVRTSGKLAGARIRVDGRRMPDQMRSLPAMWEGPPRGKRWRHPVFGATTTWVGQASRPTFYAAVQPSEAQTRAEIERVVGRIFDRIERAR